MCFACFVVPNASSRNLSCIATLCTRCFRVPGLLPVSTVVGGAWRTVVSDWRDWTRLSDLWRLGWQDFFVPTVLLSTFIPFSLTSPPLSWIVIIIRKGRQCKAGRERLLYYFNLTVPMRKCSGWHSYMTSTFSIALLNGTSLF